MASILKHLRSSTADKRPTASGLADGQIAINTASGTPAMFFKDSAGNVVKVGPAHVGTSAPNASPAGSAGNSTGELWVDNSLTTPGLNYYTGSAFVNLTPSGTTSTVGLVELATNAETQAGSDAVRAVTSAGLQSKLSDSTSTTSSTTIASSTAVKSAYDLANAALPKSGGTLTGELLISPSGSLVFEGSSDDSFETTIAVTNPTADRTITFPNVTGTVITTGDTGSVTSTMIANDTIVDADINASAAIAPSKLGSGALPSGVTVASANIVDGTIVNADVNASAAIAGTKISPDFGGQNVVTTGNVTGAALIPSSSTVPTNGVYLPSANNVALATNSTQRLLIEADGDINVDSGGVFYDATNNRLGIGTTSPNAPLEILDGQTDGLTNTGLIVSSFLPRIVLNDRSTSQTYIDFRNDSGNLIIGYGPKDNYGTRTGEHARIDSSGRLGLGTSAPSVKLEVKSPSSATNVLQVTPTTGSGYFRVRETGGNDIDVRLADAAGTESVLINSDGSSYFNGGNVGIGTTSPGEALSVSGKLWVADDFAEPSSTSDRADITITNATGPADLLFLDRGLAATRMGVDTNDSGNFKFVTDKEFVFRRGGTSYSAFNTGSESARIDSSGRLLVGTSTSRTADGYASGLQLEGTTNYQSASISLTHNRADTGAPEFRFCKSRGTSAGAVTLVNSGDILGRLYFYGTDGSAAIQAARISAEVDGTPGTNDMPGRLVLSVTLDGASSPTEAFRITNDRVVAYNQPDVTSKSAAATLTVAELKTGIIQYTGAAATLTLPTGTLTEGGFNGIYTNMTFEWSVINTGSGTCTIGAGTGHTIVGSTTVAAGASGRFASRRTAANTFVTYRLS
jgi:hypothetical protein